MDGVSFRDFEEGDRDWVLGAMVESIKATLSPEKAAGSDPETLFNDAGKDFDRYFHQAKRPVRAVLAWKGGQRIGFVWVTREMPVRDDPNSAWLLEVYVVPELRGQGLGHRLMEWAEGWARDQGAKELWLNVGGGNEKALSLYRSQGFRVETMHLSKRL